MGASVPKIIKNFNLFVGSQGLAGLCSKVTLPEFKIKKEDHRAGGLDAPIPMDMGMEAMEIKIDMAEHTALMMGAFGLGDNSALVGKLRMAQSDNAGNVQPYIIDFEGMLYMMGGQDVESGGKNDMSHTVQCHYIQVTLNGTVLIEIDVPNMKRVINGNDQLAAQRSALGM